MVLLLKDYYTCLKKKKERKTCAQLPHIYSLHTVIITITIPTGLIFLMGTERVH